MKSLKNVATGMCLFDLETHYVSLIEYESSLIE